MAKAGSEAFVLHTNRVAINSYFSHFLSLVIHDRTCENSNVSGFTAFPHRHQNKSSLLYSNE